MGQDCRPVPEPLAARTWMPIEGAGIEHCQRSTTGGMKRRSL
jgi:hypothetical protein